MKVRIVDNDSNRYISVDDLLIYITTIKDVTLQDVIAELLKAREALLRERKV
jgi:hypothetical protein